MKSFGLSNMVLLGLSTHVIEALEQIGQLRNLAERFQLLMAVFIKDLVHVFD